MIVATQIIPTITISTNLSLIESFLEQWKIGSLENRLDLKRNLKPVPVNSVFYVPTQRTRHTGFGEAADSVSTLRLNFKPVPGCGVYLRPGGACSPNLMDTESSSATSCATCTDRLPGLPRSWRTIWRKTRISQNLSFFCEVGDLCTWRRRK